MGIMEEIGIIVERLNRINANLYVLALSAVILAADYFMKPGFSIGWIAVALCGLPIVANALYALVTERDIKADLLVSMAIISSVIIGNIFAAGTIALIMSAGAYLENYTVSKARKGIEALLKVRPSVASVRRADGEFVTVPAEEVKIGDTVRVLAGDTIPVDGIITEGVTSVDESVLTGESLPRDKAVGDSVMGGTVSRFGSFLMEAKAVGEDTSIQKFIRLVDSVDPGKAKIVTAADRWATWIVVTALVVAYGTFLFTGDVIRSVTVLVVFCPCSYVLATPTAIMAAIGNLSRRGVLVREGDALERMADVSVVAFDKTGTITSGQLGISGVIPLTEGYDEETILNIASAAEGMSEHPIGRCIAEAGDASKHLLGEYRIIPGKGVIATLDGKTIAAGNETLLEEQDIPMDAGIKERKQELEESGHTVITVASEHVPIGLIALSDTLREGSKDAIRGIHRYGVETIMVTGDSRGAAVRIAEDVGVDRCFSSCLPEDKLKIVWIEARKGGVCMIGDGVNDVAALRAATVGVAMGMGTDAATESADIVLVEDGIAPMPHVVGLSKKTKRTIHWNLAFATGLNGIALILAVMGLIDPIAGAIVHNLGSAIVIIMSAMLLGWKQRGTPDSPVVA